MSKQLPRVMLIDGDPLVQEGLKLLLQDMQYDVVVVRNYQALQQLLATNSDCPHLVIAPVVIEQGITGENLINELRLKYKFSIPAILLNDEHREDTALADYHDQIFFCDDLNPVNLRKIITNILGRDIMP